MKSWLLLDIVDKEWSKILGGRFIRAIFGTVDDTTPFSVISDLVRLQTEKEIDAFYDIITFKPIHGQVISYRDLEANPMDPNSWSPDNEMYFPKDLMDASP